MAAKRKGLGRGLDALLGPQESSQAPAPGHTTALPELPVERLQPGRYQPREQFTPAALEELAASIKAQGVMQPIVVRLVDADRYEIIAGERRWRAAQQAGLATVPVVVRKVADKDALVLSLVENLQREDLTPLEEAAALRRLIDDFAFTHQAAAAAVGKSRSAVTNLLRLLQLAPAVKQLLAEGALEMAHARALLPLSPALQLSIARKVAAQALNVRQTEELVRRASQAAQPAAKKPSRKSADIRRLETRLGQHLGQPVQLQHSKSGRGRLTIPYTSLDELDGLLQKMGYDADG